MPRMQQRRDTANNWAVQNPILAAGEIAVETDTLKVKIGDGATAWDTLGYFGVLPIATDTVLGGVKDGSGVTISIDGTISADLLATGITSIVAISQGDYDLLSPPDATTLYVIT